MFFLPSAASAGSATGLTAVLANCQNPKIRSDIRIDACNALIHSNLVNGKMLTAFYALRAQAYYAAKDDKLALQDYDEALIRYPDFPAALVSRAKIYMNGRNYNMAAADYDHALRIEPDDSYALVGRCGLRLAEGKDLEDALNDCNAAVKHKPEDAHMRAARGRVHLALDHCADAKTDFDFAVKAEPSLTLPDTGACKPQTGAVPGGR